MTEILSIGIPVSIGVVAGIVIALLLIKKFNVADKFKNKLPAQRDNNLNYETIIKEQIVCDVVSIEDLKPWFDNQKAMQAENADITFMLAKPTIKVSKMLGLDKPPTDLDIEHNLLQAVILNKNKVVAVRLISFNSLPLEAKQKLDKGPVFLK